MLEGGAKPPLFEPGRQLTESIAAHFKVKTDKVLGSEVAESYRARPGFTAKTRPRVGTIPHTRNAPATPS